MDQLKAAFSDPPKSFRPQPFWFLNHVLDHDLLRVQIAEMADKGVGGVVLHPRHGLRVPFMSKAWLDAIEVCVEELSAHGMEAWLYDEDNWPSGNFGGRLTRGRPENRMRYLRVQQLLASGGATYQAQLDHDGNRVVQVLASRYEGAEDGTVTPVPPFTEITRHLNDKGTFRWSAPPGEWLITIFWECPVAERVTWFRGYYVDSMNPEAMRQFLEATYEPNLRFAEHFGETVKGAFTDEPGLMIHDACVSDQALRATVEDPGRKLPGITLPWTRDCFERFKRLKGYDLRERLTDLVYEITDDWSKVRCDFFDAVSSWYVEAYHQQLSAWCQQHGLEYIGHTLEDPLYSQVRTQGNQSRVLEQMHRPGLDYLGHGIGSRDNPYRILASKCASSVAHVMGRRRVMCEAFGASGHGHRLADRRLDLNFMAALGVNMIIPHAFYYSFAGLRKTDWPPCEFYHAPYWPWYKVWADYIGRLCLLQTQGHHVSGIAILSPVKTVAVNMVQSARLHRDSVQDRLYAEISDRLLRLHYDYDYLDESQVERAQVGEGRLFFESSDENYSVIILPAIEIISRFAAERLLQFFEAGGKIVALNSIPIEADRRGDDERVREIMALIFQSGDEKRMAGANEQGGRAVFVADPGDLQEWLARTLPDLLPPHVVVEAEEPTAAEDIIACHRTDGRYHFFLLVNRRKEEKTSVLFSAPSGLKGCVEEWDLETGLTYEIPVRNESDRLVWATHLDGSQARAFVIDTQTEHEQRLTHPATRRVAEIVLSDSWRFETRGPNVCILDSLRFVARDQELGRKLGVVVPGQVNSYSASFKVQGKLEDVRLVLDDVVPELPSHVGFLTGRRNVEFLLNGKLLPAPVLSSWMDPFYLEIELDDYLQQGENLLQVACTSLLEEMPRLFEPLYIVGRFEVRDQALRSCRPEMVGPWTEAGYPFYSGIGVYSQNFEIPSKYAVGARLVLMMDQVHDCCRVLVNGEEAGVRLWEPWVVDLSPCVKPGVNELTIEVANSATNLFNKEPRVSGLVGSATIVVEGVA